VDSEFGSFSNRLFLEKDKTLTMNNSLPFESHVSLSIVLTSKSNHSFFFVTKSLLQKKITFTINESLMDVFRHQDEGLKNKFNSIA